MADDTEPAQIQRVNFLIKPNAPVTISDGVDVELSAEDRRKLGRVGETLKAYRSAVREMLSGKYAALRDLAPTYMTEACCAKAFLLRDGIIIRHDVKRTPDEKGFVGINDDHDLAAMAPTLSGSFVHCPVDVTSFDPGEMGVTLSISTGPADSSSPQPPFLSQRLYAVAPRPSSFAKHIHPSPIAGLRNEFDIQLFCETAPPQGSAGAHSFILRSRVKLPLGWEAFEIFPPYDDDTWNPNTASSWAECDLLASVVRRNLADAHLREVDPHAQARKEAAAILRSFEELLAGPEEPIHQFIRANPKLLLPTQVQAWSKLAFGSRVTDFVLRDAAGDYLLVEIEKASHELFGKSGKPRAALEHAIDQTTDWKRYLAENVNTVQRELGLFGISTNPRALVVIGRSSTLTDENRRKLTAMELDRPKLKIMTYDDLLASARATFENVLGPLWDPGPNAEIYHLPPLPARLAS